MKHIELLVLEGCANIDPARAQVAAALASVNVPATVTVVRVESAAEAARLRFLGSPTVRVDGIDVEPSAGARHDFGLQCRVYVDGGRMAGVPPLAWIEAALRAPAPLL